MSKRPKEDVDSQNNDFFNEVTLNKTNSREVIAKLFKKWQEKHKSITGLLEVYLESGLPGSMSTIYRLMRNFDSNNNFVSNEKHICSQDLLEEHEKMALMGAIIDHAEKQDALSYNKIIAKCFEMFEVNPSYPTIRN
jgi:hypothetical protein